MFLVPGFLNIFSVAYSVVLFPKPPIIFCPTGGLVLILYKVYKGPPLCLPLEMFL